MSFFIQLRLECSLVLGLVTLGGVSFQINLGFHFLYFFF